MRLGVFPEGKLGSGSYPTLSEQLKRGKGRLERGKKDFRLLFLWKRCRKGGPASKGAT